MTEAHWYILDGNEPAGPYTEQEVLTFPGLNPATQICRAGVEQWRPLREVPELYRAPLPVAAPAVIVPPAEEPENRWVFAGLVARMLSAPRPLLFLMLLLTTVCISFGVHAAFRSHIDPRLEDAQALLLNNQPAAAEAICRTVMAERPDSARGSFLLAESLFLQGRNREALAAFKAAQIINPRDQRIEEKIIVLQSFGAGQ